MVCLKIHLFYMSQYFRKATMFCDRQKVVAELVEILCLLTTSYPLILCVHVCLNKEKGMKGHTPGVSIRILLTMIMVIIMDNKLVARARRAFEMGARKQWKKKKIAKWKRTYGAVGFPW